MAFSVPVKTAGTPPVLSPFGDLVVGVNKPTPLIPFTVADAETPAGNLIVGASSSNQVLIPNSNIFFGGTGGNRTMFVQPAADQTGLATIAVSVTDTDGNSASQSFRVVVGAGDVVITAAPASAVVDLSGAAVFTVNASGQTPLQYQWLHNGINITGANDASLTISNVQEPQLGVYSVVVTDATGGVMTPPAILATCYPNLPAPVIALVDVLQGGDGIQLVFEVSNRHSYPSEMFRLSPDLPACGLNTSASRTWVDFLDNAGNYIYGFCAITNPDDLRFLWVSFSTTTAMPSEVVLELKDRRCSNLNSQPFSLNLPAIYHQPKPVAVLLGSTAEFSVDVFSKSGSLSYQWMKDGAALPNATGPVLKIQLVTASDAGSYTVAVTNAYGTTVSVPAALTIVQPPSNDLFTNRTPLSGASVTVNSSNTGAAKELSEPSHAGFPGGASVWWTWTAPADGDLSVNTVGSDFDTLLAVYTGDNFSNLTVVAMNVEAETISLASALSFRAAAGTVYQIAVDGYNGDTGNIVLHLNFVPRPAYTIGNLAGTASVGSADGGGSAARFFAPQAVAADSAGNVYVADTENSTIRKIAADGTVSTFAGSPGRAGISDGAGDVARFDHPGGIAIDSGNNLYIADSYNNTVRKITPAGIVSTVAGSPGLHGSQDGSGSSARFNFPTGMAVDSGGNIYVSDSDNSTIRKITPAGNVTTLAGQAGASGAADGPGNVARFDFPMGLAVDAGGNVYVADRYNYTIRRITASGDVSTVAGLANDSGTINGIGSNARFAAPTGIAADGAGNLYVSDGDGNTIRKIGANYAVTILAGAAWEQGSADGIGAAATFNNPGGVAADSAGFVYVADSDNHVIRKITPAAAVSTLAGFANGGGADGAGSIARFWKPNSVAVDSQGNVYVADTYNHAIRKITPAGITSTFAGSISDAGSADGLGTAARFDSPFGVAVDSMDNVYVADSGNELIRRITPAGAVTTIAGSGKSGRADGPAAQAQFGYPEALAVDAAGNIYVADTENQTIRKITRDGFVETLAGSAGVTGSVDGLGGAARFRWPSGIAVDLAGMVYVADYGNSAIRKITPEGFVSTLAGGADFGSQDGPLDDALFDAPIGIAVDHNGNIYVADWNSTVREISAGIVTTLAGFAWEKGSANGTGSAARFNHLTGIAVDTGGAIYLGDWDNNLIRTGAVSGGPQMPGLGIAAANQTQSIGLPVWFGVGATGTPPLRYQWKFNDTPLPGETNAVLFLPAVQTADAGNYTVVISNSSGSVTSAAAVLTVVPTPAIGMQPRSLEARAGSTASFTVSAGGAQPLSFQWLKNSVPVSGATSATLTLASVQTSDAGNYTVVVSNSYGSVTSAAAVLTVLIPPPNDLFADRIVIADISHAIAGSNVNASKEPGEPDHAGYSGGTSVWWTWTAPADGMMTIDTIGSSFDTLLAVYTGDALSNLVEVASNDDLLGQNSRVTFPATAGASYQIAVDGYGGRTGTIVLHLNLTIPYAFATLAGLPSSGAADGTGAAAQFNFPEGVTVASSGNLFVADTENQTIRMVTTAGVVTTFAGKPGIAGVANGSRGIGELYYPRDVASDASGNLYLADGTTTIRKISAAGEISTLAGMLWQYGSSDGQGTSARFNNPSAVAVDLSGNVYVADTENQTIRKITPDGLVSTVAGSAAQPGSADGIGSAARFHNPTGVAADAAANLYVADSYNFVIRKITPAGAVSTLAGSPGQYGEADGVGSSARFGYVQRVAVDSSGNVYVTDSNRVRTIAPDGTVRTLAGQMWPLGSLDGVGTDAQFNYPVGIAVDSAGVIYVADTDNDLIRQIGPGALVSTLAGPPSRGSADGRGSSARFNYPYGVAIDSGGNVYVTDEVNSIIRKITPDGAVGTFAGQAGKTGGDDGVGASARFNYPRGLAVDSAGNIYVADAANQTIRKITPAASVSTVAGLAGAWGSADGRGPEARFASPSGIAVDSAGIVYVADTYNHTIRKITPDGTVTTLAGSPGQPGTVDGIGSNARFTYPESLAVDSAGTIYLAPDWSESVRKITPDGTVSTIVLFPGYSISPGGITVDTAGNIFISGNNNTVQRISPGGAVSVIGGQPWSSGSLDGLGGAARFNNPTGIAIDSGGTLYLADDGNNTIRLGFPNLTAPRITMPLLDQAVLEGAKAVFSIGVIGTPPLQYQWEFNGTALANETNAVLILNPAQSSQAGSYRVVVSNSAGSITSLPATLTVWPAITITTQPQSVHASLGSAVTLTVIATGPSGLTYQWQENGIEIPGATAAALALNNLQAADAGRYNVIISSPVQKVRSAPAYLIISTADGTELAGTGYRFDAAPGEIDLAGSAAWRSSGGVNGSGYIRLTDAQLEQAGAFALPEFTSSGAVQGFTIDADVRIGNGTLIPADGLSISFVRLNDPVLASIANGKASGFSDNGIASDINLIEEGTVTGLSVGLDAWRSGTIYSSPQPGAAGSALPDLNIDVPGLDVRVDGVLIGMVPMATLNGECADPASIQTGKFDGSQTVAPLCWQPLHIEVTPDGLLKVAYKNSIIVSNLQTGFVAGRGRFVIGARTGAASENHHLDNLRLSATLNGPLLAPSIVVPPADQSAGAGGRATLAVTAAGSNPLQYQWRYGGSEIAGATNPVLHLTGLQIDQSGNYSVRVSNSVGTITSAAAVLTVFPPPTITAQPQSATVEIGSAVTFSLTAAGGGQLAYQWTLNGFPVANATNASYAISNAQLNQAGTYAVTVSNAAGSVTSETATLAVTLLPNSAASVMPSSYTPAAAFRVSIIASPASTVSAYTVQDQAPASWAVSTVSDGGSVNLGNNTISWGPFADHLQRTLSYDVTPPPAASGMVSFSGAAAFDAINIAVAGQRTLINNSRLLAFFPFEGSGADLIGASPPMDLLNTSFVNGTLYLNGIYQYSSANGYRAVANIPGLDYSSFTVRLLFNGISFENAGSSGSDNILTGGTSYRWLGLIRNSLGGLTLTLNNQASSFDLAGPAIETNHWHDLICSLDLSAKLVITYLDGTHLQDITLPESFNFEVVGSGSEAADKQFSFSNYSNGRAFYGYADNLMVYDRALSAAQIASLIDIGRPVIATQPQSQSVSVGANVTMTVTATGAGPFAYQWQKGGIAISGATTSTLALPNVQSSDAAAYTVVVSNPAGAVTSQPAVLVVNTPGGGGAGLIVTAGTVNGSHGATVSLPVTVTGFSNVVSLQFSMHWDPAVAQFVSPERFGIGSMTVGSFGAGSASTGTLTFSWDDPAGQGVNLASGAVLFAIKLNLVGANGASSVITIDGSPTQIEASDGQLQPIQASAAAGHINVTPSVHISGKVTYYHTGVAVPGVAVGLSGDSNQNLTTGADGSYSFTVNGGGNYAITPSVTSDSTPNQGITTLDIALIRRHILSVGLLDSAYKLIAADVNGSKTVTTLDIALIRRVILAVTNNFPGGNLWRFVPASQVFSDQQDPWAYLTNVSWPAINGDQVNQDFVAIKLGDVNNSWTLPAGGLANAAPRNGSNLKSPLKAAAAAVRFAVGSAAAIEKELVILPVQARGFNRVTTAQFTIEWDPAVLEFAGTGQHQLSGLSASSFGTAQAGAGKLTFSWDDPAAAGVTLPDGSSLFALHLRAIGAEGTTSGVVFSDQPTPREVTQDSRLAEFGAESGTVTISKSLPLNARVVGQVFSVSISTQPGMTYFLEGSDSLADPHWVTVDSLAGTGGTITLSDPRGAIGARFYRVGWK